MARKPLRCKHCRKEFPRRPGAGLFCGVDCEKAFGEKLESNIRQLQEAGFSQHAEAPNLWHKDGVHLSIEHINHAGFHQAIAAHQSAIAEHAQKQNLP